MTHPTRKQPASEREKLYWCERYGTSFEAPPMQAYCPYCKFALAEYHCEITEEQRVQHQQRKDAGK